MASKRHMLWLLVIQQMRPMETGIPTICVRVCMSAWVSVCVCHVHVACSVHMCNGVWWGLEDVGQTSNKRMLGSIIFFCMHLLAHEEMLSSTYPRYACSKGNYRSSHSSIGSNIQLCTLNGIHTTLRKRGGRRGYGV